MKTKTTRRSAITTVARAFGAFACLPALLRSAFASPKLCPVKSHLPITDGSGMRRTDWSGNGY